MAVARVLNQLSPSQLDAWSTCRLRWYWVYPEGWSPLERNIHFDLGTGIHSALAAYYKRGADPVKAFSTWIDKEIRKVEDLVRIAPGRAAEEALERDTEILEEARTLGLAMLTGYVTEYKSEKLDVLAVEQTVRRSIPGTDWVLEVRIDTLVRDHHRRKKLYVLEHKSFTRFYMDYLDKDHQFVAEKWAAEILTVEPIAGVLYNGLRKQVPGPRVSVNLFERHAVEVSDMQVKQLLRRLRDMYRTLTRGKLAIYPEPSPITCGACRFKEPCGLYMKGGDYRFVLENMFAKREEENEEEEAE